ncbi:peptidoglycan DD-metalloendopeptidase family protein [soil metagenome]
MHDKMQRIDWVPDLGARIGTGEWFRGAATCIALCTVTVLLSPGFDRPLIGSAPAALTGGEWDAARAQAIAPLAYGADSGWHVPANNFVRPLKETPERPTLELSATIGQGDDFDDALQRAGVGKDDAQAIASMVSGATAMGDIKAGTRLNVTLGRRPSKDVPRPLEKLDFRARFDLALSVARVGGKLTLTRQPIAIDHTPMRIRGMVGSSLYRSARAAGAPAKAVEAYIKALATRLSVGRDVGSSDSFDIIVEQARAATGEVQLGQLLFAGLNQGSKKVQLVQWGEDGHSDWFDAGGTGQRKGSAALPVAGHITSTFGLRRHPILGFMRMHKGIDIGAPWGTPIHAAIDGIVAFAGRTGGYGNFVKLSHSNGFGTGYGHMSRIAVRPGMHVSQGQVIGYVGSTGMSTGPHVHYELYKNGTAVNPATMSFSSVAQLSGRALAAFKAKLAGLMAVRQAGQ